MKNFDKSNPEHLKKLYNLTKLYHLFSIYSKKDEFWTNIKDYNNYQISNYGRVKSLNYKKETILKLKLSGNYYNVVLCKNNKTKGFLVHRLVLETFKKSNKDKKERDHINQNSFDNRVCNLRYTTFKKQMKNRTINKERESIAGARTINMININNNNNITKFKSIKEAREWIKNNTDYKASTEAIWSVLNGNRPKMYGYKWIYETEEEYKDEIWKYLEINIMKEYYPDLSDDDLKNITRYQISNYGRVKGITHIIKGEKEGHGYVDHKIKKKHYLAHRLVAIMFIFNDDKKKKIFVDHKNNDKSDNRVENLRWCTPSQNIQFSVDTAKLSKNKKKIAQYDLEGNFIKNFNSIVEAEKELNIHNAKISRCCKNQQKTADNFIFKFI